MHFLLLSLFGFDNHLVTDVSKNNNMKVNSIARIPTSWYMETTHISAGKVESSGQKNNFKQLQHSNLLTDSHHLVHAHVQEGSLCLCLHVSPESTDVILIYNVVVVCVLDSISAVWNGELS